MSAPWKQLLQQSLRKNEALRNAKYFQIATVRPDGRPANRTVVYRGFLWDTDRVTFVTDLRLGCHCQSSLLRSNNDANRINVNTVIFYALYFTSCAAASPPGVAR